MSSARRAVGLLLAALGMSTLMIGCLLSEAPAASASTKERAIFEDDVHLLQDPAGTLYTLRQLGASTVRFTVHWSSLAPSSPPAGFNGSDPASYPASSWAPYDEIVRAAQASGLELDFVLTGGAPKWATAPGIPSSSQDYGQWKPSASEYGRFVQAVATRYSGSYRPCSTCSALPRVHFWELWNEANWGQDLAPQASGQSTVTISARYYRPLLDAGWSALGHTGHGQDVILMTSLSPRGHPQPGAFLASEPLVFMRALYCVNSSYHQLRGGAAAAVGCPRTKAGSRGFRSAHPALFKASGIGIHPYPINLPPTKADSTDPNYVEFNEIPRLAHTLDRLERGYGGGARMPVFNNEYSYETNPPNHSGHFVSPQTAGFFINWAEYLSWRSGRIASYDQYLLYDPNPSNGASLFGEGGFATGLVFYNGNKPKADYAAYRMPIFMPVTSAKRHHKLEVWGCVRPAHVAQGDTGQPQLVRIQLVHGGHVTTVQTVTIHNPRGYFDVHVAFPTGGTVRLAWSYPTNDPSLTGGGVAPVSPGQTVFSRSVAIKVR